MISEGYTINAQNEMNQNEVYISSKYAKIRGATMVASLSIMNFGVLMSSFPQVIFSFGTAPE